MFKSSIKVFNVRNYAKIYRNDFLIGFVLNLKISNVLFFLFEEDVSLYFENFEYFCSNNEFNIKKLP